jgi:cytochrome o ubiquinol oxidase subunit II
MKHRHPGLPLLLLLCVALAGALGVFLIAGGVVLEPKGPVAAAELSLIRNATWLMLIVVVPVFALLFWFAWWYRAENKKAKYLPEWEHARMDELIWWAIPFEIVLVLAALIWSSSHALDPHRPLDHPGEPLVIEAVALPWKWLFIYPELGIATLNELRVPVDVPLEFKITADAPMNSLWIPALGGQVYAMTGMTNRLHLLATEAGVYRGLSGNYSGEGFADMRFAVHALPQEEFDGWTQEKSGRRLDWSVYQTLRAPGTTTPEDYRIVEAGLYERIIMQFMQAPAHATH